MDQIKFELKRLLGGTTSDINSEGKTIVPYEVASSTDIGVVIEKATNILIIADKLSLDGLWPSRDQWAVRLPVWFVSACSPEKTPEQLKLYLEWWDGLNREQKLEYAKTPRNWSLMNWTHAISPNRRSWLWWDSRAISDTRSILRILVDGHPFSTGSLEWLLRASGADTIIEIGS